MQLYKVFNIDKNTRDECLEYGIHWLISTIKFQLDDWAQWLGILINALMQLEDKAQQLKIIFNKSIDAARGQGSAAEDNI